MLDSRGLCEPDLHNDLSGSGNASSFSYARVESSLASIRADGVYSNDATGFSRRPPWAPPILGSNVAESGLQLNTLVPPQQFIRSFCHTSQVSNLEDTRLTLGTSLQPPSNGAVSLTPITGNLSSGSIVKADRNDSPPRKRLETLRPPLLGHNPDEYPHLCQASETNILPALSATAIASRSVHPFDPSAGRTPARHHGMSGEVQSMSSANGRPKFVPWIAPTATEPFTRSTVIDWLTVAPASLALVSLQPAKKRRRTTGRSSGVCGPFSTGFLPDSVLQAPPATKKGKRDSKGNLRDVFRSHGQARPQLSQQQRAEAAKTRGLGACKRCRGMRKKVRLSTVNVHRRSLTRLVPHDLLRHVCVVRRVCKKASPPSAGTVYPHRPS
jgi:hypothetical protein